MKLLISSLLILYLLFPTGVRAIENPLAVPNNKYGIHIVDENDLQSAASLVNSSKGDWGYVTLVITEGNRNVGKWQKIFDQMYKLHLIPILRLATENIGNYWKKPELSEGQTWAKFLSKLTWVTRNRYVVLFNEPNHAKEWGNTINPQEYAEIVASYSETLKGSSPDFFILPAGLDASAPNSNITMDEVRFLKLMLEIKPDIFSYLDGWVSHSYPNPGFVGKVEIKGRGTLRTYQWELNLLNSLGNKKNLPVFITETGWPHKEGYTTNYNFFTADKIADFITQASETVWDDKNIVAVTPFILNYQSYPFSHFSWQEPGNGEFYPQYDTYRSIAKVAGAPILDIKRVPLEEKRVLGVEKIVEKQESLLSSIIVRLKSLFLKGFGL